MDIEDLFENDRKHHKHRNYRHGGNSYNHHDFDSHEKHHEGKMHIMNLLKNNPRLKFILISAILVILIIIIAGIFLLLPLLGDLFNYVSEKGILETINTILNGKK